jgi:hypothetical protein
MKENGQQKKNIYNLQVHIPVESKYSPVWSVQSYHVYVLDRTSENSLQPIVVIFNTKTWDKKCLLMM